MLNGNKDSTNTGDQKPPLRGGLEGPKILVFDNYDSFTYNLVHLVEKITHTEVDVYRNDQIALEKVKEYDKIILSPGPGIPEEAGLLLPLIKEYAATKSILGDATKKPALFEGLPEIVEAGRYHSWIIADENFPAELEVTARDENNYIMALQHKKYDVQGVQFHPESVLTPLGEAILRNWLKPPTPYRELLVN